MRIATFALSLLAAASLAAAGEVKFSTKPSATKAGGKVKIAFAVSASTDVEVSVLDAKGGVVRHLAAGVLGGKKAPPPPLTAGLSQALEWDMRDDLGKPAKGGPFKVRVRAGAEPVFGGVLGRVDALGSKVYGLATDEKGELYVATGGGYGKDLFTVKVFDRKGEYLRTIFPYPANLKAADVDGFGKQKLRDGKLNPPHFDALLPWIHPNGLGGFMGNTVKKGVLWLTNGRGQLCRIRSKDGGCISWGGTKSPAPPAGGPICWAAAADGKTLYLAGWRTWRRKWPGAQKSKADGQIYKVDPATGERTPFIKIDVPEKSFWLTEINGWYSFRNWGRKNGLAALHGMAVDAEGRIYACDRVNQRIGAYDKGGKYLGGTKVEWPDYVALGPKGELYVTTRKIINGYKAVNEVKVVKLSDWKDGKVLAELTLPGQNAPSMAVDATEDPAVIWLSNVGEGKIDKDGRGMKTGGVTRIEDRGGKLVVTGKLGGDPVLPEAVVKVWADPFTDDIVVSNAWSGLTRLDGLTGKKKPFPLKGIELCFGPDKNLYVHGQKGWSEPIARFDRNFKPVVFSGTGKNTTGAAYIKAGKPLYVYGRYGHGWCDKGLYVAPTGRIYMHNMYDWNKYYVNIWGPDGKTEKHSGPTGGIVGPTDPAGGGLRVDAKGNIYVGIHGAPAGSAAAADRRRNKGAIVKFPPTGGGYIKTGKDGGGAKGIAWTGSRVGNFVKGAVSAYTVLAPQVGGGCVCREARFDLDGWGRLYIPNGLGYYVKMVDNAGNQIAKFGYYANGDSRGPESAVPEPGIPLGWPFSVSAAQVNKKRIYVADTMNRRVIRVELKFAAEATCPVPAGEGKTSRAEVRTPAPEKTAAAGKPAASVRAPAAGKPGRTPKQVCAGWFSAARNYKKVGMLGDARRCLKNIIKTYPQTEWARKARGELARL